ncbi:MAG: hypothetical protein JXA91_07920 [Candidatus Thermoplasmatota archaeon]|nr:hypothetical protein [Candidatus Thermoplasmatota archaeon]
MKIVGLLSTPQEAQEIQFISKMCILRDRIHFLVKTQKIKEMLKKEVDSEE